MADHGEPRIPPVQNAEGELAETLAKTLADPNGRPLNIFLTMARHPRLLKRWNVLAGAFRAHGLLAPRERELVVLRTAWRTRARYEWGQHVLIAREAGVAEDEIAAAAVESLDRWPERERALLRFTDELLRDTDVSDEVWEPVARMLDQAELIELVMLVGLYRMAAGFLNTLRVVPEPYLPDWPSETAERR
ncbi:carboxymuconolactone decarboxylase family protein [Actinomadura sp. LD22]|uniref:Carboxymuconolactone decarboxylase family protein n=1 Tax=Actinomadura physcomitrii TaxID=2650748 RepID=A0A6I4MA90_9ACTN|nr:carboxymuconolactone decarboxylase family protein [Actinomadura physcomitrii]MWA02672.1 carboxymuconolactone decarboxylase family protein [Actinomadura physcomitrii]